MAAINFPNKFSNRAFECPSSRPAKHVISNARTKLPIVFSSHCRLLPIAHAYCMPCIFILKYLYEHS